MLLYLGEQNFATSTLCHSLLLHMNPRGAETETPCRSSHWEPACPGAHSPEGTHGREGKGREGEGRGRKGREG